jgi:peptidoglycan-associated lipoprotein
MKETPMNRKSLLMVWIGALALSMLFVGCPKKKPAPAPVVEEPAPAPAEEVVAPTPPAPVDEKPDPFSEDIETANRAAYEQGLLGDVYFDFDKFELKSEARERLAKNAEFMKAHPEFMFNIQGHCDERGTAEYNLALGERRANTAKDYLMSLGIPASRIKTISYGEERPQCTESGESCWWRNRRDHFLIVGRSGG